MMTESDQLKQLLSHGAEIVGGAAGGAIGSLVDGPAGATMGGAIAPVITISLQKLGEEFSKRTLSPREESRVGAGLIFIKQRINLYLEKDYRPRQDDFFDQDVTGRSASDEILEGVLLKCKNEYEEKKLKLIANIYANTAFQPQILPTGANWLLQEAQRLTYRQLCIIALIDRKEKKGASYGPLDGDPAFEMEYRQLDYMFARDHSPDSVRSYEETGEGLRVIGLSRIGMFCYELMSLNEVPESDLRTLRSRFPNAF